MVLTPSTMLPLGTVAPDFTLQNVVTGDLVSLYAQDHAPATLVMFICNHCPYVKHINEELARLGKDYHEEYHKGGEHGEEHEPKARLIAICSNDVASHPDDDPKHLRAQAEEFGFTFPYLYDETQRVAKAYQAACTPDFFLFDKELKLAYRGQLDASRPGNDEPVNGADLRAALDAVLAGKPVPEPQTPSVGCNIKWA